MMDKGFKKADAISKELTFDFKFKNGAAASSFNVY